MAKAIKLHGGEILIATEERWSNKPMMTCPSKPYGCDDVLSKSRLV